MLDTKVRIIGITDEPKLADIFIGKTGKVVAIDPHSIHLNLLIAFDNTENIKNYLHEGGSNLNGFGVEVSKNKEHGEKHFWVDYNDVEVIGSKYAVAYFDLYMGQQHLDLIEAENEVEAIKKSNYLGNYFDWKGVETFAQIQEYLMDEQWLSIKEII